MKNQKKGSVLVFALIVLSFLLMTAFSVATVSMIERRSSGVTVNSSTAFQNSDEGMEEFLQQLYKELDQMDTLEDMGKKLNKVYGISSGGYECVQSGTNPARLGDQSTDFIITAYEEFDSGVPTGTETSGGWEKTRAITDCGAKLADVSRFRATGNYNNASRAVFLKLKDSLQRGLVAHWSFEDRAQNASLAVSDIDANGNGYNSFIAGDSSKNNYTLTLCQVYLSDASATEADIKIENDNDPLSGTLHIVSFDDCEASNTDYMSPFKYESGCNSNDDDYNEKCSDDGAWQKGIVEENEILTGEDIIGNEQSSSQEALYFDGQHDYLTALIDDDDCYDGTGSADCDKTVNYVDDVSAEQLNLKDGIAISVWIKPDEVNGAKKDIVSLFDEGANGGYRLYQDEGDVCFQLNDKTTCTTAGNALPRKEEWKHIVALWRKEDEKLKIYVDGGEAAVDDVDLVTDIDIPSDQPLYIGAGFDGTDNTTRYFKGIIDDVRIWKRALTDDEVLRLCKVGVGDQTNSDVTCAGASTSGGPTTSP